MKRPEPLRERLARSVYVWAGLLALFVAFIAFAAPPLLLLHALGLDPGRKLATRVTSAGFRAFLAWCAWVGLARVRGRRPAGEGPSVVVSNHESSLDIALVLGFSPPPARLVARGSHRRVPLLGQAVVGCGCIFTEDVPGGEDAPVLEESVRSLREGSSVIFFAEGTRSRAKGVRRFRKGAFEVAAAAGVPVLPCVIVGSGEFMPAGGILPLGPYRVTIEFLEPRRIEGDPDEFRRALRHEIAAAHARILAEPFHEPTRIERTAVPTGPASVES